MDEDDDPTDIRCSGNCSWLVQDFRLDLILILSPAARYVDIYS